MFYCLMYYFSCNITGTGGAPVILVQYTPKKETGENETCIIHYSTTQS